MKRQILMPYLLIAATLAFSLKKLINRHLERKKLNKFISEHQIANLEVALTPDSYFGGMDANKLLGAGTYGVAVNMTKKDLDGTEQKVAVKISTQDKIDEIPSEVPDQDLLIDSTKLSNIYSNLRFLKYLESKKDVPFLLKSITDRNILVAGKNPEYNTLEADIKNVWAQEMGDLGDLHNFSENVVSQWPSERKRYFILNMMVKTLAAMERIVAHKVMHGDIKPANIFLKSCSVFSFDDICPIIGDWDLGYFYDKSNPDNFIPYTLGYRPPEMIFFNSEFEGYNSSRMYFPHGYFYSEKEDMYALGAAFADLLYMLKIDFRVTMKDIKDVESFKQKNHRRKISEYYESEEFQNMTDFKDIVDLIENMIYPIPIEEIYGTIFVDRERNAPNITRLMKTHLQPHFDKTFISYLDKIKPHIYSWRIPIKRDYKCNIEYYQGEADKKTYNPGVFIYKIMNCLARSGTNLEKLADLIADDKQKKEFKEFAKYISQVNPLDAMLKKRFSAATALEEAKTLFKTVYHGNPENFNTKHMYGNPNNYKMFETDRNTVYVANSFLELSIDQQVYVCRHGFIKRPSALNEPSQILMIDKTDKQLVHDLIVEKQGTFRNICKALHIIEKKPSLAKDVIIESKKAQANASLQHSQGMVYLKPGAHTLISSMRTNSLKPQAIKGRLNAKILEANAALSQIPDASKGNFNNKPDLSKNLTNIQRVDSHAGDVTVSEVHPDEITEAMGQPRDHAKSLINNQPNFMSSQASAIGNNHQPHSFITSSKLFYQPNIELANKINAGRAYLRQEKSIASKSTSAEDKSQGHSNNMPVLKEPERHHHKQNSINILNQASTYQGQQFGNNRNSIIPKTLSAIHKPLNGNPANKMEPIKEKIHEKKNANTASSVFNRLYQSKLSRALVKI